jgi:uncharacterized phage protein gp47/JayE
MFENMTYENILKDMLSRVTSDVDKREGSVIYDALAPTAYQLAQNYFHLDAFIDLVNGDTAVGEYLDRVVANYGITRKPSTYSVRKITTSGPVAAGTRWSLDDTSYIITELINSNQYKAICEQLGEVGNQYSGILENIDNVSGVTATLEDILITGEDEETDDNLRTRYFTKIQLPSTSGNAYHYRQWALEVTGVGDAKIFPLWNGPGTVKVVIVDSDKQPAGTDLVAETEVYIEEVRPIGAAVTVESGEAKIINASATLILAPGYSLHEVINTFAEAMTEYFKSITFSLPYVSYAKAGTILLGIDGVLDYSELQLNGMTVNIPVADEEMPVLGTVELGG